MKKRKIIISMTALLIIAAATTGMMLLSGMKKNAWKMTPKERYRYVEARKVVYQTVLSEITGTGRLASLEQVDIITEMRGPIMPGSVPLKKGQSFKRGDLLFKIDSREARFALIARRSRFLSVVARLIPDIQVDFPTRYNDWKDFLNALDIEKELPKLPFLSSPKEKIFLAGRNVLNDYYAIKSDQVTLKKYAVFAPFSGTYTDVFLEAGTTAAVGSKVGAIIRTDKMELEVHLNVAGAQWVHVGSQVDVTDNSSTRKWLGKVVRKAKFVDQTTQSIAVFVQLKSPGSQPLLKNIFLKASFHGVAMEHTMEIPREAVFNHDQVYVVDNDNRLKKKQVKLHFVKDGTVVVSGLEEGAQLVTESLLDATESTKVTIDEKS
jgi:multidrug efflux pump subunit AcrA (membrane-fusion protein)